MIYKILKYFNRKRIRKIADYRTFNKEQLIEYYTLMAIESVNQETTAERRIFSVSMSTIRILENGEDFPFNKPIEADAKNLCLTC